MFARPTTTETGKALGQMNFHFQIAAADETHIPIQWWVMAWIWQDQHADPEHLMLRRWGPENKEEISKEVVRTWYWLHYTSSKME